MAERRMFAKTIIDSDAFLDMPLSTQSLYFHLSMRADDDGFINNPKKIQRMIGASDDDLRLLVAKRFIIPFDSGIVVIKHWRIHNYIQKDRYKETTYKEEMALLEIKENNSYTLKSDHPLIEVSAEQTPRQKAYAESNLPYSFDYKIRNEFVGKPCPICGCIMSHVNNLTKPTIQHNISISKGGKHEIGNISVICARCNKSIRADVTGELNAKEVAEVWDRISCIRDGYGMDTQVRLGKVRDKDKREVGEISTEISEEKPEISGDVSDVVELFHTICKSFPKVVRLSDPRKRAIRARMKAYSMEDFRKLFEAAEASPFLKGENDRGWRATFDWLMNEQNMTKVLEGAYADTGRRKRSNRFSNFDERPVDDIAELERQLRGKEVRR